MEKHVKQFSKNGKQLKDICKKATRAEKRAKKLTKRILSGMNIHHRRYRRKTVPPSSDDVAGNILESALVAEKQGERLVQRILGASGR